MLAFQARWVVGDLTLQTQTIHSTHFPSARDPGFRDIMALMLDQLLSTLSEVPLAESSVPSSGGCFYFHS